MRNLIGYSFKKAFLIFMLIAFFLQFSCIKEESGIEQIEPEMSTLTDIDNNVYQTIKIGNQWWMAENLKATHYSNGDEILFANNHSKWSSLKETEKAFGYYDNDERLKDVFGAIYNYAAASNNQEIYYTTLTSETIQGVCPDGWHLPSDNDWQELERSVGLFEGEMNDLGYRGYDEGSKLAGEYNLWAEYDLVLNKNFGSSKFDAIPGGFRDYDGSFYYLGVYGVWWTSSSCEDSEILTRWIHCQAKGIIRESEKKNRGFSVRCVKD